MTNETDEQLQQLANLLKTTAAAPDDPALRLAEALVADDSYSHALAEQDLPLYVADELLGRPAARLHPALHRHLLNCQPCAALHADMLEDLGEEPEEVVVPAANLSFLPSSKPAAPPQPAPYLDRLRRFAEQAAEAILATLRPASLSELALVAEVFFDQVGDQIGRVALQPAGQTAFNFSGSTPPVLRFLAASAVTTYRLGVELPPQRLVALRDQNQLQAAVRATALRVANSLSLGQDALPFADAYTRWLLNQIESLPRPD